MLSLCLILFLHNLLVLVCVVFCFVVAICLVVFVTIADSLAIMLIVFSVKMSHSFLLSALMTLDLLMKCYIYAVSISRWIILMIDYFDNYFDKQKNS